MGQSLQQDSLAPNIGGAGLSTLGFEPNAGRAGSGDSPGGLFGTPKKEAPEQDSLREPLVVNSVDRESSQQDSPGHNIGGEGLSPLGFELIAGGAGSSQSPAAAAQTQRVEPTPPEAAQRKHTSELNLPALDS